MNLVTGTRVALYVRVSTEKQVTEGHSLDGQRAKLYQYACERGLTVVECIVDEGVSAKTLDRPGMDRLMELVEARQIDAVAVTKADRVSRSLRDLLNLTASLETFGVALVTVDEQIDTSTPMGKAMQQVRGAFSELERSLIAARTREGMQAARDKGVRLGRPPVGWSVVDGRMVPNERYRIVEKVHGLRDSGLTLQQIADRLGADGELTGRGSTRWYPASVSMFLKAPLEAVVA